MARLLLCQVITILTLGMVACGDASETTAGASETKSLVEFGGDDLTIQPVGPVHLRLDWSDDRDSLQRQLFDVLLYAEIGMKEIFLTEVQAGEGDALIRCETNDGFYACDVDLPSSKLEWSSSSESLAAVLYHAIYDSVPKARDGMSVELQAKQGRLACSATTLGMAQVMSYSCSFEAL